MKIPECHAESGTAKPRILDAFCCAGGATFGYQAAGFHVTGVDINPHPDYCGDDFIEADAVAYIRECGHEYDFVHASPPCQDECTLTLGTNKGRQYVQLIPQTRKALESTSQPWIIENVPTPLLRADLKLCGLMFGLQVFRHRTFEISGFDFQQPHHPTHAGHRVAGWRHGVHYDGDMFAVYGNGGGKGSVADWQQAMGMIHTMDRSAIAEAIPPAYSEFIGRQMLASLATTGTPLNADVAA